MGDENARRAAEEYLAAKLSAETQSQENRLNREAAERLATSVWKHMADTVAGRCKEWNEVAGEQVLTCRETMLGDLRILCAGRPHQLIVHFDSRKLLIIPKNSARLSHETDMILLIEGYSTGRERPARLMRNDEPVNLNILLVGELRVLAGLSRARKPVGQVGRQIALVPINTASGTVRYA